MNARQLGLAPPILALLIGGMLAISGPATAIYIVTPLTLTPSTEHAEVGDEIDFTIAPQNDTEAAAWAGRTVRVEYSWDTAEGEGAGSPEEPTSDETYQTRLLLESLTLDDAARGAFTWTVPDEVADHNVDIRLVDDAGEGVAFTYVAIGDAPPQMRILAGSGMAEGGEEPADDTTTPTPAEQEQNAPENDASGNAVPAAGAIAALGALGIVALALARRKR